MFLSLALFTLHRVFNKLVLFFTQGLILLRHLKLKFLQILFLTLYKVWPQKLPYSVVMGNNEFSFCVANMKLQNHIQENVFVPLISWMHHVEPQQTEASPTLGRRDEHRTQLLGKASYSWQLGLEWLLVTWCPVDIASGVYVIRNH